MSIINISNLTEAEQYLCDHLAEVFALIFPTQLMSPNTDVLMQLSRDIYGTELKAWSFILMPPGETALGGRPWLTSNGYIFYENSVPIEDWIHQAIQRNDFEAVSRQSLSYVAPPQRSCGLTAQPWPETGSIPAQRYARAPEPTLSEHQYCPICNAAVAPNARYPKLVCQNCYQRATSPEGRGLDFRNGSLGSGFKATYIDNENLYVDEQGAYQSLCYIDGMTCKAEVSYFGGIVIQTV